MKLSKQDKILAKNANLTANEFVAFCGLVAKALEACNQDTMEFLTGESKPLTIVKGVTASGLPRFNNAGEEQWGAIMLTLEDKGLVSKSENTKGEYFLTNQAKHLYLSFSA